MRRILGSILACVLTVGSSQLAAEESAYAGSVLDDEFFLIVGGFFPSIDSSVQVDSSSGIPGTGLDFEDQLGLESSASSPYLYFRWRYHPVHRIELEYYRLLRDGTRAAQAPFRIGDVTGDVGVGIQSKFDVTIARLTYGYDIFKEDKWEFGILAGAHVTSARASFAFSGNVTVDSFGSVSGGVATEEADITFPLPHV